MAGRAPTSATSCRGGEVEYRFSSWRRCQHRSISLLFVLRMVRCSQRFFAHSLLVYVVSEKVISCAWSLWVLYLLSIVLSFASLPAQSNTISSPVLHLAAKVWSLHEKRRWACRHGPYQVYPVEMASSAGEARGLSLEGAV
ncbi:hypothetical protein ACQJBY_015172 [Aegilops geniculata]